MFRLAASFLPLVPPNQSSVVPPLGFRIFPCSPSNGLTSSSETHPSASAGAGRTAAPRTPASWACPAARSSSKNKEEEEERLLQQLCAWTSTSLITLLSRHAAGAEEEGSTAQAQGVDWPQGGGHEQDAHTHLQWGEGPNGLDMFLEQ